MHQENNKKVEETDFIKFKSETYKSSLPSDFLIKDINKKKEKKSPIEILNKQLISFYEKIKPQDFFQRKKAVLMLKEILQTLIVNKIDLKIFGSVGSKNYLPSSDIDVKLILKKNVFENLKEKCFFLEKLALKLEEKNIPCVFISAKVPILKINFKKFKFDLSLFSNKNDKKLSENENKNHVEIYEKAYKEIDGLKIMHLLIKQYFKNRNYNFPDVVVFILCHNFLYFYPFKVDVKENLAILMLDFFHYFGHTLNKKNLGVLISLKDYARNSELCFEDPYDGETLKVRNFFGIQHCFYHSYKIMDICLKEFMHEKSKYNNSSINYISLWIKEE